MHLQRLTSYRPSKMENKKQDFNIVLINPCINDDALGAYRKAKLHSINLGIGSLAAYTEKELSVNIHIIDARFFALTPEEAYSKLVSYNPNIVGFSLCVHEAANWSGRLIKLIRVNHSNVHVSLGGYFPSLFPEKVFMDLPDIDSIVIGEGELIFCELCKCLKEGNDWKGVSGIAYRDKDKQKTIITPSRALIKNLDTLPWPRRYLAAGDGSNMEVVIEGARGCVFKCTFCAVGPFYHLSSGSILRIKSAQYLYDEITFLCQNYPKLQDFRFLDPDFIASKNKEKTVNLLKLLNNSSFKIRMHAEMRAPSIVQNRDLLIQLREAGLVHVNLGIESGSQKILDKMQKHCRVSDILEATAILRDLGIDYTYGFMMITPWVIEEDIEQNINLLRNIGKIEVHKIFSEMTIIPGTTVFEQLKSENRLQWQGRLQYYSYLTESPKIEHFREIGALLQMNYPQFFKDMLFIYSCIRNFRLNRDDLTAESIERQSDQLFIDLFDYCWSRALMPQCKTSINASIITSCFNQFAERVNHLVYFIKNNTSLLMNDDGVRLQS